MALLDPNPLQPFLDKLDSRSNFGAAEGQAILDLPAHPAQIETNRDFVRLGERVEHASFVVAGLVGRFGQNRDGSRQITAVHIPSDMVNLHSVVVPEACSALQALSVTTILRVPHWALRDVAHRYPALAEAFWRESVVDAAVLSEWVVNVGRRDAQSRVAHLLCEIVCRVGDPGADGGLGISFPATQTHIADMTGLTSVHVNRTLKSLREAALVEVRDRAIHVLDWNGLCKMGDFDAGYLCLPESANDATLGLRQLSPIVRPLRQTAG